MTLTEAAINVRASEKASANYLDDAKLSEAMRDALIFYPNPQGENLKQHNKRVSLFLELFRNGFKGAMGSLLEDITAEEMVAAAYRDLEREREKQIPQLPDCTGCRVDLGGEVECCQEKP